MLKARPHRATLLTLVLVAFATPAAAEATIDEWIANAQPRLERGDIAGALFVVEAAMKEHPDNPKLMLTTARIESVKADALGKRGMQQESGRSYRRALNLIARAEELAPTEIPAWAQLVAGYAELGSGNPEAAEERFTRCLAAEPTNPEALRLRARIRAGRGELAGAEADLASAVEHGEGRLELTTAYARVIADRGRVRDAIDILWKAYPSIAEDDDERRWRVLGQIHHHALDLLDFDGSMKALDEALRIAPRNLQARLERGILLYRLERFDEADDELEAVLGNATLSTREQGEALFRRGLIAQHAGELEAARRHFEASVAAAPDEPAAHQSLAVVLLKLGDREAGRNAMLRFRETTARAAERRDAPGAQP